MPTLTTNYSLNKPLINNATDEDLWGGQLNDNMDTIDEELKAVSDKADTVETDLAELEATVTANLMPAGVVQAFAGVTVPTGWVECNGASLGRTTYAALFAAIGTIYGAADGGTFKVPDFRGVFLRGLDGGRGLDPDSSRAVGSYQADAFQGHEHTYTNWFDQNCYDGGSSSPVHSNTANTGSIVEKSGYGAPRYTTETRPKNYAIKWIIKT
jgi:microcystin-dependent protein